MKVVFLSIFICGVNFFLSDAIIIKPLPEVLSLMSNVDPGDTTKIIDMLKELKETSEAREQELSDTLALKIAELEEAMNDVNNAQGTLAASQKAVTPAEQDLAKKQEIQTSKQSEKDTQQILNDGEIPPLDNDQETINDVVILLEKILNEQEEPKHYVVQGGGLTDAWECTEDNMDCTSQLADVTTLYGVRCCSDTRIATFSQNFPTLCSVWGSSLETTRGGCQKLNWMGAASVCLSYGARLCSKTEVESSCTTGTGCGYDGSLVWTSTQASDSCGSVTNNNGAPLPNMPIKVSNACDCSEECQTRDDCKAWTFSSSTFVTNDGRNCWLRSIFGIAVENCDGNCRSGSGAESFVEANSKNEANVHEFLKKLQRKKENGINSLTDEQEAKTLGSKTSHDKSIISLFKENPSKFVTEMTKAAKDDPASIIQIIDMLKALNETSQANEKRLVDTLNQKIAALGEASTNVILAEKALATAQAAIPTAEQDLANKQIIKKTKEIEKIDAQTHQENEIDSLNEEQEVYATVINFLQDLIDRV